MYIKLTSRLCSQKFRNNVVYLDAATVRRVRRAAHVGVQRGERLLASRVSKLGAEMHQGVDAAFSAAMGTGCCAVYVRHTAECGAGQRHQEGEHHPKHAGPRHSLLSGSAGLR